MAQITGGKVLFGRTVKTGDYENKRVDVELAFSVGDNEDYKAILDLAAAQAHAKAHEMLGLREKPLATPAPAPVEQPKPAEAKPQSGPVVETAGPKEADAKKRAKKPPVVADPAAVDVVAEQPKPAEPEPANDPAAVVEEEWAGAPAEITDADLMAAITKKNGEIKQPQAIRNLIGKYVPAPKPAREIPQDKRQAFLAELGALKPAQAA